MLDGSELPIWDDRAMNKYRFKERLDRAAVRDERAEPDAQDRPDRAELLKSRGVDFHSVLP